MILLATFAKTHGHNDPWPRQTEFKKTTPSMDIHDFALTPSIINQYMTELRDVETQTDMMRFRRNLERIGELMAYEIRDRKSVV